MMKRYGERVNPNIRYTPRPGAYVILQRGRDLLLTIQDWSRPTLCLGDPLEAAHTAVWVPMDETPALLSNEGDAAFVASLL